MAKAKEAALWCVLVAFCILAAEAENREPVVQVFTRYPLEAGKENILQCYVDQFHPPKISITLLKNDMPLESQQSDLSFHNNWAFHRLIYTNITVDKDAKYVCVVDHVTLPRPVVHKLDMDF
ncbi:beta-2-microglobulin [Paroedura picta]|uniref:beta-2-microglobulin n=1 Tax=Paroedura picta TaxID=143630 RepID=UPI00405716F3